MDFFEKLANDKNHRPPAVWVSRMVLYSKIKPTPDVIREIRLNRGFNIIWAEETEEDKPEAMITGHSAGKTTFCRLLRYLLGEKHFSRKKNEDRISSIFPKGYVAGEIHVHHEQENRTVTWAVLRPIGKNRRTFVLENGSIEQLIKSTTVSVTQDQYSQKLGFDEHLNRMGTATIVRTDETIKWGHLLSWCTRDQENRFQNIHEWRSPRSESESPSFKFPKDGPLFVMRTALGLFLSDELKGEETLAGKQKEKDRLEKELEKHKREPLFRTNLYRDNLKNLIIQALGKKPPEALDDFDKGEPTLYPVSLEGFVKNAIEKTETEWKAFQKRSTDLQNRIDDLGAEVRQVERELAQLDSTYAFEKEKHEKPDSGAIRVESEKKLMDEHRKNACLAGKLHEACDAFNHHYEALSIPDITDIHFQRAEQKKWEAFIADHELQKRNLTAKLTPLKETLSGLRKERIETATKELESQTLLNNLKTCWKDFDHWQRISCGKEDYPNLTWTVNRIKDLETYISTEETRLSTLIKKHDKTRNLLSKIFSNNVRSVLPSGSYDGEVTLVNRELSFAIKQNTAMSGEAIETLSVLLTDISCLIFNAVNPECALPGFLLHDSPREADLSRRIYLSFIRFVEKLHLMFGGENQCPFQYILTTTTAPPVEIKDSDRVKLRLNASVESELLLKKDIFANHHTVDQIEIETES